MVGIERDLAEVATQVSMWSLEAIDNREEWDYRSEVEREIRNRLIGVILMNEIQCGGEWTEKAGALFDLLPREVRKQCSDLWHDELRLPRDDSHHA